ncbi:hypothetical protein FRC07_011967 [Ceratobasidium sp. 392]|nr:hypothetical protein FRC07_011967 [Ceratobasidium sp. 392]
MLAVVAVLCLAVLGVSAHPLESKEMLLPTKWFRDSDSGHPVHNLFTRQKAIPVVGSPEWAKKFPAAGTKLTENQIPKEWTDALKAAIAAGKIPSDCPVASTDGTYHIGSSIVAGTDPTICSSAVQCHSPDQVYDVPDGHVALSFDDGPAAGSKRLNEFLRQTDQRVTHFYIGSNILTKPDLFQEAFTHGDDIAVHTWSHSHTTQLSNELVLAELGWTVQIIHDSTGGRLPMYWRPPYGESDRRVRAIAKEIFGLTTVIWNKDTDDWQIGKGITLDKARLVLTEAYKGPKSPGLNILEHEVNDDTVKIFIDTYPLIKQNGWTAKGIPGVLGKSLWLNAANNTSPVTERPVAGGSSESLPASTSSVQPSTTPRPFNGASALTAGPMMVGVLAAIGSALML